MIRYTQNDIEAIDLLSLSKEKIINYRKTWEQLCSQHQNDIDVIDEVEGTSPLLNFNNEFNLQLPLPISNIKSCRKFSDKKILMDDFKYLMSSSFFTNEEGHRIYGSAGALYPVEPLIVNLSDSAIIDLPKGIYGLDYLNRSLRKLNTEVDSEKIKYNISPYTGQLISSIFICYIFSITRTVAKYNYRGFRHMLIEVGEMTQTFRLKGSTLIPNFGDVSWSGFDDKGLKENLGLKNMYPVLLQFFGIQNDK